jgi:hypothetical protein
MNKHFPVHHFEMERAGIYELTQTSDLTIWRWLETRTINRLILLVFRSASPLEMGECQLASVRTQTRCYCCRRLRGSEYRSNQSIAHSRYPVQLWKK